MGSYRSGCICRECPQRRMGVTRMSWWLDRSDRNGTYGLIKPAKSTITTVKNKFYNVKINTLQTKLTVDYCDGLQATLCFFSGVSVRLVAQLHWLSRHSPIHI